MSKTRRLDMTAPLKRIWGTRRMQRFASPQKVQIGEQVFTLPAEIPLNYFAYEGSWNVQAEYAKSSSGAALEFKFHADKVFLVIGPAHAGDKIKVLMDGKLMGDIILDNHRLYEIIDLKGSRGNSHSASGISE